MNFTIWKFPLKIADVQSVEMPRDARILSAQLQDGAVTLWAMVQPAAPRCKRVFWIVGTGHRADHVVVNVFAYISTVQDANGFVWHLFDGGEE